MSLIPAACAAVAEPILNAGYRRARDRPDGARMRRCPPPTNGSPSSLASILFIQVPGPSLLFTIGRALTVGRRDALLSVAGNGIGMMVQVVLIAVGLAAVVTASSAAYAVVKVIGASYVIWLGLQAIRHRGDARATLDAPVAAASERPWSGRCAPASSSGSPTPRRWCSSWRSCRSSSTPDSGHVGLQMTVLGVVFGAMAICSDSIWALAASRARDWFSRKPTRLDTLGATGGVMMVGLGATMLASE